MIGYKFFSEYKIDLEKFNSFIIADNWEEAELKAMERGIGEIIVGKSETYEAISGFDIVDSNSLLHAICFLSFIALMSGKATPIQILGDRGVLHELIHLLSGNSDRKTKKEINKKIKWLFDLTFVPHNPCVINRILFGRK